MQTYVTKLSDTQYKLVDGTTETTFTAETAKYNNKIYLKLPKNSVNRSYIELKLFNDDLTQELLPAERKTKKSDIERVREYLHGDDAELFDILIEKAIKAMKTADIQAKMAELQKQLAELQGQI